MTLEPADQAPQQQGTRSRQMQVGRGLAAVAYNLLMKVLQEENLKLPPETLARLVETGSRIESHAYQNLPTEVDQVDVELDRVLGDLGLEFQPES